jgi:hypothetical protein
VLEEHRLDVELVRLELVEDQLRIVGAVVAADAGVVAPDDEVRAAVVLAADRVPDRLARTGVAHRRGEGRDDHPVGRVVAVDEHAVALDAGRRGDVLRLRLAHERVDEEAVDGLERNLGQVLVGSVNWISRLKSNDAPPATLRERGAGVGRVERELRERRRDAVEHRDPPGEVEGVLVEEARDPRMVGVGGAEAALGLALLVVLVDLADLEHREQPPLLVGQRDAVAFRSCGDRQADGQRPRQRVREPHVLDHALVVVATHEALERRERAGREHVEVGDFARGQGQRFERLDAVRPLAEPVD